jgi:hypothetical protein
LRRKVIAVNRLAESLFQGIPLAVNSDRPFAQVTMAKVPDRLSNVVATNGNVIAIQFEGDLIHPT